MKNVLRLLILFLLISSASFGQNAFQNEINAFATKTGAIATIDKATNSISFLRFPTNQALTIKGITSNDKALVFMEQNASIFGVKSGTDSFSMIKEQRDAYGLEHVVLQQYVNKVPVYDGLLKFHYNKSKDLTSLNGNFIQVDLLNTIPTVSKEEAEALALKMVESQKMKEFNSFNPIPLKAYKNTLYVFQKGLVQGYNGPKHLVYEVEVRNNKDIREFLFIDAHTKELVEQFTAIHAALDRKLYQPTYNAAAPTANLLWKEGDAFPGTLDQWQKSEIESAGHIYNLMKNAFGRISYNGADATMITTNNNPSIACPNANWNGITANYCNGTASDDVVAHEWAHAYTEYTSGLIYAWQSGALNEAYSDIWGETVDQLNGYFDSGEGTAMRASTGDDCPSVAVSTRWKMGEQATAFTNGSLRDMYNPNCNNHPGRVSDPFYYCTTQPLSNANDLGGVHLNSGVINHSYALLVDGGTYNGQTITGIGLTKAAHIFWYAQANFMTKTTDFAAQADILQASAQALMDGGINLKALSTGDSDLGLSGLFINANDLLQLQKVILAVELRMENNCGYTPMLQPLAAICNGGSKEKSFFFADFEAGLGNWTVSNVGSNTDWNPKDWVLKNNAPKGRAGQVVYGFNANMGDCVNNLQTGVMRLLSPEITIPASANGSLSMAFDHYVSVLDNWDGGIVNYKIGAGGWIQVPLSAFIANGYNKSLYTSGQGNLDPLAGKPAFSGSDGGSTSGSWGQSRINLSVLGILPNDVVQFRWDLGSYGCSGRDGWYIDDVRVYSCDGPGVQFVTETTVVNEAEGVTSGVNPNVCLPYVEKIISVKINASPSGPVTVTLQTSGTATMGETGDYSITPTSFDLADRHLTQDITVRIFNDAYVEGNETVVLNYTMSGGDGFPETVNQTHTITINDNDVIPGLEPKTPLFADFNDGLIPFGWTDGGTPNTKKVWKVSTETDYLDQGGVPFLWASSDALGPGVHTFQIETAPFNTLNMTNLNISFLQYFRAYISNYNETATVEVWDGTDWHVVLTQTQTSGTVGAFNGGAVLTNISIPEVYANAAMKLRFSYTANYDWWWALDNIKVTGMYTTQIETAVTSLPDQQYLGPLGKAYFYDPSSKDLLATVENLSNHDYGCTSVAIDRAGNGSTTWVGPYIITNKSYLVTPSNPNPTGKYKITIYYKDTELGAFKNSVQSMGKSEGGITTGNLASSSFAEVEIHQAFNTDWAYTAEFDSGFSGFGLSDAPPVGPLPVTLVKFEGKNSENGNILEWSTTSETENDYFVVERATDANNFKEITRVAGTGTSSSIHKYSYVDTKFSSGLNYYRLKQIDRNGTFAYSKMVVIESNTLRALQYFPNPVQTMLNIKLPVTLTEEFDIDIVNGAGQVVMKLGKLRTTQGFLTQDVSQLMPGVYQVLLSNRLSSYSFKVVKL